MSKLDNELETLFRQFSDSVDKIALREFQKVIKPYLKSRGYQFIAGNGTFYIEKGKYQIDIDKLPQKIYDILQTEIPGMRGNSLGTLMPDYNPNKEIEK